MVLENLGRLITIATPFLSNHMNLLRNKDKGYIGLSSCPCSLYFTESSDLPIYSFGI